MAEVLGVVASGIAVAQLADQIATRIRNIHAFWKSIRGAPQELNDALEELEILGDTLLELHLDLNKPDRPGLPGNAAAKCLSYCRRVADNLETIVMGLQRGLDGKRGPRQWAAIKAAFQNRTLQEFQQRLDRAKSMLTLAISCYSLSIHRHSASLMLAHSATAERRENYCQSVSQDITLTTEPAGAKTLLTRRKYFESTRKLPFLGLYQYQRTTTPARWRPATTSNKADEDDDVVIEHRIIPAQWLRWRLFSFQSVRSSGIWTYSFRPVRIVPHDSPIFQAGGVNDIIALLEQGQGSIHDTLSNGRNLLHFAAKAANPELCKWLIDQGVDSNAVDYNFWTPLFLVDCSWNRNGENEDKVYDTARVLVEHGQLDLMSVSKCGASIPHHFTGSLKTFKYLIESQEQFMIDLSQIDWSGRTPLQAKARDFAPGIPLLLKYLLDNSPSPVETAREVWLDRNGPMSLLLGSVERLSERYCFLKPMETEIDFMSQLIRAGSDLHVRNCFGATPLDHLLNGTWSKPHEEPNKECLLLIWMSRLCRCGIDLQQYWRKEEELHKDGKLVPVEVHRRNIDRIFTVYYGASRDDVTVLVEDTYRNLDERWGMPGSWDSEIEYSERNNLLLIEGESLSAFWSITTAGFRDGDYSPERAGCQTGNWY